MQGAIQVLCFTCFTLLPDGRSIHYSAGSVTPVPQLYYVTTNQSSGSLVSNLQQNRTS